ncbi:MAG TPA: SDR family NAD(P)-dependent oxidoreductase [Ktedonobacterales bacterium]
MKLEAGTVSAITGAGSGIGRALALNLSGKGCALALADIDAQSLEETAALARTEASPKVTTHRVDVSDWQAVQRFADEAVSQHGGVQLLINNAGVALGGTFDEITLDDFAWLMDINFWGVVYGVKAFLPILQRQSSAHIVNLSSVFGLAAPPGQTAYASSKFAVRGFTEALRAELRHTQIHVSTVHPGGIKTNIARNARTGVTDPARIQAGQKQWEKLLRIPPEQAAATIVRGITRNKARILIGNDARLLDMLSRLFPGRVGSMLAAQAER